MSAEEDRIPVWMSRPGVAVWRAQDGSRGLAVKVECTSTSPEELEAAAELALALERKLLLEAPTAPAKRRRSAPRKPREVAEPRDA